jgi:protein-S-isoprenylcysteine O-methyltransferase Ste14
MNRNPVSMKYYRLLMFVLLLAILLGLVMVAGRLVPLEVAYRGPVGTFEIDSAPWVEALGVVTIAVAAVLMYWIHIKHREALLRIQKEQRHDETGNG